MQNSSFFDTHTDEVTLVLQKLDHKSACSLLLTRFSLLRDGNTKLWVDKRVEELETQLKAFNKEIHDLKWATIAQDPPAGAPYVPPLSFFAKRIDALNTIMKQRDNLFVVLEEVTKLRKVVAWIILHRVDGLYGTSYLQSAFPSRNR